MGHCGSMVYIELITQWPDIMTIIPYGASRYAHLLMPVYACCTCYMWYQTLLVPNTSSHMLIRRLYYFFMLELDNSIYHIGKIREEGMRMISWKGEIKIFMRKIFVFFIYLTIARCISLIYYIFGMISYHFLVKLFLNPMKRLKNILKIYWGIPYMDVFRVFLVVDWRKIILNSVKKFYIIF